jgi:hypothetical protein
MVAPRIPSFVGGTATLPVDHGTSAPVTTPAPNTLGLRMGSIEASLRELQVGAHRGWQWVSDPVETALRDLQSMGHDLSAQWHYIAQLPAWRRDRVVYELFALGFSHDLPKKLLRHHVWGLGKSLTLSLQEMIDCNPHINLRRSKAFRDVLAAALASPGKAMPFELGILSGAMTNGTLGQFTTHTKGTVVAGAGDTWSAQGKMRFHDEWNFDPKDFDTGGRSVSGELKTRFANAVLPGKSFKITSVLTDFSQAQADATVVWAGGPPRAEPDRLAAMDMALSNADQ